MLEMFASYFSRDKTHPILLISDIKENEGPVWVSATEVSKLAVGRCSFTCCERNHIFEDKKVVKCDRFIIQSILDTLIKKKINSLLISAHCVARFFIAMKSWWLRGLVSGRQVKGTIEKLKAHLLWDDVMDGTSWKCRDNISILLFAVLRNELSMCSFRLSSRSKTESSLYSLSLSLSFSFSFSLFLSLSLPHTHTHTHIHTKYNNNNNRHSARNNQNIS